MKNIILLCLCSYLYISTFCYWYLVFKNVKDVHRSESQKYYYLFIGSVIGISIFLYGGFSNMLFFIGDSVRVRVDDDFIGLKYIVSGLFAGMLSLYIHCRPFKIANALKSGED